MKNGLVITGVTLVFALFLCVQGVGPVYGAEQEGQAGPPAAQQARPEGMMQDGGMMHGRGMMQGQSMMGRMIPPPYPCAPMMGRGRMEPMGPMGHPMMRKKMWPGMGMEMMGLYADPKTRGQMMEIRGRMLQEIGKLMEQRGKEIAAGKK